MVLVANVVLLRHSAIRACQVHKLGKIQGCYFLKDCVCSCDLAACEGFGPTLFESCHLLETWIFLIRAFNCVRLLVFDLCDVILVFLASVPYIAFVVIATKTHVPSSERTWDTMLSFFQGATCSAAFPENMCGSRNGAQNSCRAFILPHLHQTVCIVCKWS